MKCSSLQKEEVKALDNFFTVSSPALLHNIRLNSIQQNDIYRNQLQLILQRHDIWHDNIQQNDIYHNEVSEFRRNFFRHTSVSVVMNAILPNVVVPYTAPRHSA